MKEEVISPIIGVIIISIGFALGYFIANDQKQDKVVERVIVHPDSDITREPCK